MLHRTKFSGLTTVFILMTGCILNPEAKLIKQYEEHVDRLMGKGLEEVIPLVIDQWKFELFSKWAKVNPTPEMVLKSTHRSAPFSEKEAQEIFEENAYYDVIIYVKKGKEVSTSTWDGEPEMYLTYHEHKIKYTNYVVLRMVFQNKKLCNYHFFHLNVGNN
jgi:hypothetical protein